MTGTELIDVIRELAPVEWGRTSQADSAENATRPPLTAWRFAAPDPTLEGVLRRAVEGFEGRIRWVMWNHGRNWVVEPAAVATYPRKEEFTNDVELAVAFGREHPDVVRKAFEDLPHLAEHVRRELRS
jgi:hypothetical protein